MSSFAVAFRSELRRARRDRALAALVVIFTVVALYAAWNGREWVRDRQAALNSVARQEQAEQAISLDRVRRAAATGRSEGFDASGLAAGLWNRPALPLRPLAFVARGQAEGYPYDARFHAMTPAHAVFERAGADLANPAAAAAGWFDLALVVVFLVPLLLFAASYDLWAQEHETGTSLMVMSQPVRPGAVLASRILARGGVLLTAVTAIFVAVLFGVAGEGWSFGEIFSAATVTLLYGGFWLLVAVLVNVHAKRSAIAAIACVVAWLSFVLLIPAMLATSVDLARPAAPQAELVNTLRMQDLELEEHRRSAPATAKLSKAERLRHELSEAESRDRQLRPLIRRYDDIAASRRELSDALRFVSPAVLVQDVFERLAGTDAGRATSFRSQSLAFHSELRAFVRDDRPTQMETLYAAIGRIPRFHFEEASPLRTPQLGVDLLALLAWLAVPWCWIVLALRSRTLNFSSHAQETG